MIKLKRRYWRRSSRWRTALQRTNPDQLNYWRLQTLADNLNPFGLGHARWSLLCHRESEDMLDHIYVMLSRPSPWMQFVDPEAYFGRHEACRQFPEKMGEVISSFVAA